MIKVMNKKKSLKSEDIESFDKMYGTFFYEFLDGHNQSYYYLIFVLRRLSIVLLVFFVEIAVLQLIFSAIFSLIVRYRQVVIYLIMMRPFKEKLIEIYTLLNEMMTLAFYIFLLLPYVSDLVFNKHTVTMNCIFIILGALVLNFAFAIFLGFSKILSWVRSKRQVKDDLKAGNNNVTSIEKPQDVFEFKKV